MTPRSTRPLLLGPLLLLALAAPAGADPLFSSPSSFDTGVYPRSVAIADLDGDGHPDLVTANQVANTVSVLIGNGDGTFRARTDFEAGGRPLSVAVADLNADGRPDLAVAGEGYDPDYAGRVSVLLGNGDGTFGARTQYGVPQWPQAVAIADMNQDGRPDLVVPSGNPTNKLSVLLGNGDGTFGSGTAFGTADFPSSVAIADLNRDRRLDVAVTNLNAYSVSVFLGNGDGTLGARTDFSVGAGPWWVAIEDVNGDGTLDLVVANFDTNSVSVLLGNGDGTFGGRRDFAVGENPRALAVADLNEDTYPDMAVANANSYTLSVLLGDGTGGFGDSADFGTGYHPNSVAIADVNSDGQPDVMVANTGSSTVSVFLHHVAPPRVEFDFVPRTLELSSRGRWVTGFLEPDPPLKAADIDAASIRLNDTVPMDPSAPTEVGDHDADGVLDLMAKFDRKAFERTVSEGDSVPVTVTGSVSDQSFSCTDFIRVLGSSHKGSAIGEGALDHGRGERARGNALPEPPGSAGILEPEDRLLAHFPPVPEAGIPGLRTDATSGQAESPGLAAGDGTWSVPFLHPASRRFHCAVYDPVRRRKLVFGGTGYTRHPLDVIWALSLDDRPQWSSFTVAGVVPPGRYGATAIYDPLGDRVVMFGGTPERGVFTNEVWVLSLSGVPAWTRLDIGGPQSPARYLHTAVFARDRMIIYGGYGSSSVLGDAWVLDLAGEPAWTEILPANPPPPGRYVHAATYDSSRDRMIVFGGNGPDFKDRNDTWELSLSGAPSWREIPGREPDRRTGHSLIYDPIGDRAVLLGGWGTPDGVHWGTRSDIWTLRPGESHWTRIPYVRYLDSEAAPAVYDAGRHHIVAYNGHDAMDITDIRLADPINNYSPLLPMPSRRYGHSAVYDSKHQRMLIYGGRGPDTPLDETWELTLSGTVMWSMLAPEGPEREFHSAIYDPVRDRMIVFSGFPGGSETWELRLTGTPAWSQLLPAGTLPEERRGHSAIYDPRRDRMIVFGGGYWGSSRNDTWALSLAGTPTWSALPPGPSRIWHHAVYDPVGDRMLVLGGSEGYQPKAEVWALSLKEPMTWSLLASDGGGPFPRDGTTAIYDAVRHGVVVFGGCCFVDEEYNDFAYADAWELSLDGPLRWRQLATSGSPGGRTEARMIYDPPRDRAIVYGGKIPYEIEFTDVRALTWGEPAKPSVSCPESVVPGSPLRLHYVVSNPLPTARAVEWTLTSERAWPGFPRRGFALVAGGGSDTVRLELPIPDEAFAKPNTLTFASWLSGAQGYADSCRHLVPERRLALGFDFVPSTLNSASRGRWVTGCLEPAPPLAASDIDVSSIRLNGTVLVDSSVPTALGDHDGDGVPDLMVKFDRAAVELTVSEGDSVPVTVTGTVEGQPFSGTDFIRVRRGRISAPLSGSRLAAGSVAQVRWETPGGVTVPSVALLFSADGGGTWSSFARGQPNTGSYDWMVPNVPTDQAKVAVLVESSDESGATEGVLGVSEVFSIGAAVGVGDRSLGEVALAIRGVTPNPAVGGQLRVEFVLGDGSPAMLELMDVAGRALASRQVGTLGPGRHSLDLSDGRALPPGMYFLRLTQGGREILARAAVLR